MSEVFDEIADDLRRQKLNEFWKENGNWIIGGAIAAVLLTGLLAFWRQWQYQHNMKATTELVQLISTSDTAKLENFAKTGRKNQAMVARFIAAGKHVSKHEDAQAIAIYNEIAGTSGLDRVWRELALIQSISLRLDKDPPQALEKDLEELSGDNHAWRYSARELAALLAARQGQMQKAVMLLEKITSDPDAPADARNRAVTLRELYAGDIRSDQKS
jgi:hypothetical protein